MVRITDRPDMTSAIYRGRKALNQTNKNKRLENHHLQMNIFFFSRSIRSLQTYKLVFRCFYKLRIKQAIFNLYLKDDGRFNV